MQQRVAPANEQISASLVETVSEIKNANGDVFFAGATLNTFAEATATRPTRPFQVLRWQPAVPLPLATYDSTRVGTTAAGAPELHVNPGFQLVSTQLETTPFLAPLSTRTATGRQLTAVHLGYTGTLPVLQIANALASEVLFSDFESAKDNAFTSSQMPSSAAARTGTAGVALAAGNLLSGPLTSATNAVYRLSFWARANAAATVTVSVGGGTGGFPPDAQFVRLGFTGGNVWRLYEVPVDLSGIPKPALSSYALTLQTTATRASVQLDDVLFLPAVAVATSTTYDLNKGKTSETDGRGRTVFYEYSVSGNLARVRDHNGAIVKEMEQVIAGRGPRLPCRRFIPPAMRLTDTLRRLPLFLRSMEAAPSLALNTVGTLGMEPPSRHSLLLQRRPRYSTLLIPLNGFNRFACGFTHGCRCKTSSSSSKPLPLALHRTC